MGPSRTYPSDWVLPLPAGHVTKLFGMVPSDSFEVAIGLSLFVGRYAPWIALLMVLHLSETPAIFFSNPALVFDPHFPFLTLAGELILRNIALTGGG